MIIEEILLIAFIVIMTGLMSYLLAYNSTNSLKTRMRIIDLEKEVLDAKNDMEFEKGRNTALQDTIKDKDKEISVLDDLIRNLMEASGTRHCKVEWIPTGYESKYGTKRRDFRVNLKESDKE